MGLTRKTYHSKFSKSFENSPSRRKLKNGDREGKGRNMKQLIKGLREFHSNYFCRNLELFEQLAQGQHPRILFITCSDSRVDPNLITQAQPGDLFVIRNAGNIIPPFGATNGGEGAAVEYAIQALDIQQVVVCGHSHCGAMKGLLKLDSLESEMPLVYNWLKHAEATRLLIKENYGGYEDEDLIEVTTAENVLTQIENLRTYPVIRSRLHQGKLSFYAWIYEIESGEILTYDEERHAFMPPGNQVPDYRSDEKQPPIQIEKTPVYCPLPGQNGDRQSNQPAPTYAANSWLSAEQTDRIYRGAGTR